MSSETDARPLLGKRVLVTRASGQAAGLVDLLEKGGAQALVVPTIEFHAPGDAAPLNRALAALREGVYGWVAFTSANGVDWTWVALEALGLDGSIFASVQIAAIGPETARALGRHGLRAEIVAQETRGEGLANEMLRALPTAPIRVLIPRAAKARDVLPLALREAGYDVDVVTAYETHPPSKASMTTLREHLEARRVDAVLFTSGSSVVHLFDALGTDARTLLSGIHVATIGPVTAAEARARGLHVDAVAQTSTMTHLVQALAASYDR